MLQMIAFPCFPHEDPHPVASVIDPPECRETQTVEQESEICRADSPIQAQKLAGNEAPVILTQP